MTKKNAKRNALQGGARRRAAAAAKGRVVDAKVGLPDSERLDLVDALRGVAIAMMIAYHVCFDLTYYGWADWPMLDDPRWIAWRSSIVASFLVVVGVSLALRDARRPSAAWLDRGFVLRWLQVAAAAALVTAGSMALFPATFIYFGVLHFVACALWICRRAPRRPWLAFGLATAALVAGLSYRNAVFDAKAASWIGFVTEKPLTEDFVPLFPWLGVVLVGCGIGGLWARRGLRLSPVVARGWNATPEWLRRMLATAGRWSLTIYLVHQPLLMGAMALVRRAS